MELDEKTDAVDMDKVSKTNPTIAICALSMVSVLVFSLLPFIGGVLADEFGLSNSEIGLIATSYFLPYAAIALISPLWVNRFQWSHLRWAGLGLMLGGLSYLTAASSFNAARVALLITALGAGILFPLVTSMAATMTEVDKIFAQKLAAEQLVPAVLLIIFILLMGAQVSLLVLGISLVALIVLTTMLSRGLAIDRPSAGDNNGTQPKLECRIVLALIALGINFAGFAGIWAFLERIGTQQGLSDEFVTAWLSVGLITGGIGSLIGSAIATNVNRSTAISWSTALAVACLGLLLGDISAVDYALTLSLLPLAFMFSIGFLMSSIAILDTRGKLVSLIPFVLAVGASAGPSIYGELTAENVSPVIVMAVLIIIGALLIVALNKRAAKGVQTS